MFQALTTPPPTMRTALALNLLFPLLSYANPITPLLLLPSLQPLSPTSFQHLPNSTLPQPSLHSPINFPIPNTAVNLTFTYLGSSIPSTSIASAINGALQEIRPKVLFEPHDPIAENRFQYIASSTRVYINIITYLGKRITYLQLSQLLYGLWDFTSRGHQQVLVFEIDLESQGRVGFGTFLLRGTGDGVAGNKINDTALSLPPANKNATASSLSTPAPFPVPASLVTLYFHQSSDTIPLPSLAGALTNALRRIQSNVLSSGGDPIPDGGWNYRDRGSYVGLRVASGGWHGGFVSWQVLSWALQGLLEYVTADGGENAKGWGFTIHVHDVGMVGSGIIAYFPGSGGSVE